MQQVATKMLDLLVSTLIGGAPYRINEIVGERVTLYEIHVLYEDVGKLVGKKGRIIQAIDTILRSILQGQRTVSIQVLEDNTVGKNS